MKKGNGYCKNHPEVPAVWNGMCLTCKREYARKASQKHRLSFKSEKIKKQKEYGTTLSGEGKRIPASYFRLYNPKSIITKETLHLSRVAVR